MAVTTFFGPLLDRGVRFIEGGIAEGELRAVDARQVLLAIYSTAMGDLADAPSSASPHPWRTRRSNPRRSSRREALLDMVFRALGVPEPSVRRKS